MLNFKGGGDFLCKKFCEERFKIENDSNLKLNKCWLFEVKTIQDIWYEIFTERVKWKAILNARVITNAERLKRKIIVKFLKEKNCYMFEKKNNYYSFEKRNNCYTFEKNTILNIWNKSLEWKLIPVWN